MEKGSNRLSIFVLLSLALHVVFFLGLAKWSRQQVIEALATQAALESMQTVHLTETEFRKIFGNNDQRDAGEVSSIEARKFPGTQSTAPRKKRKILDLRLVSAPKRALSGADLRAPIGINGDLSNGDSQENIDSFSEANTAQSTEYLLRRKDFRHRSFFDRIENQLRSRWVTRVDRAVVELDPKNLQNYYRTDTIIYVDDEGEVIDVHMSKSSGEDEFDWAAIRAVENMGILQQIPEDFREEEGGFKIQYGFVILFLEDGINFDYIRDPRFSENQGQDRLGAR